MHEKTGYGDKQMEWQESRICMETQGTLRESFWSYQTKRQFAGRAGEYFYIDAAELLKKSREQNVKETVSACK